MSWNAGYMSEIDYTHEYVLELNPLLMRFACLSAGFAPPPASPFRYLELGFGQGLSMSIHAAANNAECCGNDFNPIHVVNAAAMAQASGATMLDDSFQQLLDRPDLGEFDFIVMHGIWTWVSEENRRIVLELISRRLKVGGILYISYNCLPGWAPAIPLRHLMMLHSDFIGVEGHDVMDRIDAALKFAERLSNSDALFFRANPGAGERLKAITGQHRHYLAHEYFNQNWEVMPFSEVARRLDACKLTFATSARVIDQADDMHLTPDTQKVLREFKNPIMRQSIRDYFVNRDFRSDLFMKGARRLSGLEQTELLRTMKFALVLYPEDIPLKVKTVAGEATLQENVYKPIIEVLAENDYAPKLMTDMAKHPKLASMQWQQIAQAIFVLVGAGHVYPAQDPDKDTRARCAALNRVICRQARSKDEIRWLASPMLGGGILTGRFQQLFLLSGKKAPAEQAQFAWQILSAQGERLVKDEKQLITPEENLAELNHMAKVFAERRLPLLTALGVSL